MAVWYHFEVLRCPAPMYIQEDGTGQNTWKFTIELLKEGLLSSTELTRMGRGKETYTAAVDTSPLELLPQL